MCPTLAEDLQRRRGADKKLLVADIGVDIVRPARPGNSGHRRGMQRVGFVVLGVHRDGQTHLPDIGDTGRLPGLFAGLSEDREENGRQDRNNSDHDKQFNEGESAAVGAHRWERLCGHVVSFVRYGLVNTKSR